MSVTAPHATEMEQATLGALLVDSERFIDVNAIVDHDDFYEPCHSDIFRAMQELYETDGRFDVVTVTQKLADNDRINRAGGSTYIAELSTVAPPAVVAEQYAQHVKNKSIYRALIDAGKHIQLLGQAVDRTPVEVLEEAEQKLLSVSRITTGDDMEAFKEISSRRFDSLAELHEADDKEPFLGLRTGFSDLDRKLDGLEPSSLTIIAARPSMGKTSLAVSIAQHLLEKQGKTVAVFSLEMSKEQVLDRMIAARVEPETFRKLKQGTLNDEEFSELNPIFDKLSGYPLYVDDAAVSIAELCSKARRMKLRHGLDLLIVDYLQLISAAEKTFKENRTQEVTYITRCLKILAKELGCPLIALSQLSRKTEDRTNSIPQLSDLRDSGSIEQDADHVLMMYREDYYNEDCGTPGVTDVFVRKNRNGETGRVGLYFDAKAMAFRSLDRSR